MSGLYQVFAMLIDYQMVLNGVELIPGHYTHVVVCVHKNAHTLFWGKIFRNAADGSEFICVE